jgi:tRNA/tmRNA/rRNA uracil-C5-methylase (TrmA/RlmC/RlmD family)
VVFVDKAIPGDIVNAKIVTKKRKITHTQKLMQLIKKSDKRIPSHFVSILALVVVANGNMLIIQISIRHLNNK